MVTLDGLWTASLHSPSDLRLRSPQFLGKLRKGVCTGLDVSFDSRNRHLCVPGTGRDYVLPNDKLTALHSQRLPILDRALLLLQATRFSHFKFLK
jgi:hypothetical protein